MLDKSDNIRPFSILSLLSNIKMIKYFYFDHIKLLAKDIAYSIENSEIKNIIIQMFNDE